MEYEIAWGGDPEDVRVIARGTATVDDLVACTEAVVGDPRYRPGLRLLSDHRQADWSQMTETDVRRTVELLARDAGRIGLMYCAMVMGPLVDYGIARMRQHHVEAHPDLGIKPRVFTSIEEARRWLSKQPAPAPLRDS